MIWRAYRIWLLERHASSKVTARSEQPRRGTIPYPSLSMESILILILTIFATWPTKSSRTPQLGEKVNRLATSASAAIAPPARQQPSLFPLLSVTSEQSNPLQNPPANIGEEALLQAITG